MTSPVPLQPVSPLDLSKRAARRLIQRAFVLAGRERTLRRRLREVKLTTIWLIEDWKLEWTVVINRGEIEFHRGRSTPPQLTLLWKDAAAFFSPLEGSARSDESFECVGDPAGWKIMEPLYKTFRHSLDHVLRDPVDELGDPLL